MKKLAVLPLAALAFAAACSDNPTALVFGGERLTDHATVTGPISGAIFTTDVACEGVNLNIYGDKGDVYLNGGPRRQGTAALPDGHYFVKVTEPNGTVLGTSATAVVTVTDGKFAGCYQLSEILLKASNGAPGYDDTTNRGGEYKVWISSVATFPAHLTKTDNFKVKADGGSGGGDPEGNLEVLKFYDRDADGHHDAGEPWITGWRVLISGGIGFQFTPFSDAVDFGSYNVTESTPLESNWVHTTAMQVSAQVTPDAPDQRVIFGNVCLGAGGGRTLGFWSNKNGGDILRANDNSILKAVLALNLRKADGSRLGTTVSLGTFQKFLTEASATNMANMLSAQLAAMKANTLSAGGVSANALIYAPGTTAGGTLGFATVTQVMDEANELLATGGTRLVIGSGHPDFARAEALKNALDRGNNNVNFVQANACPFSFPAVE